MKTETGLIPCTAWLSNSMYSKNTRYTMLQKTHKLASSVYHLVKADDSNDMDDNRLLDCSPILHHFHVCSDTDTMAHVLFLHYSGATAIATVDSIRREGQHVQNCSLRYTHWCGCRNHQFPQQWVIYRADGRPEVPPQNKQLHRHQQCLHQNSLDIWWGAVLTTHVAKLAT